MSAQNHPLDDENDCDGAEPDEAIYDAFLSDEASLSDEMPKLEDLKVQEEGLQTYDTDVVAKEESLTSESTGENPKSHKADVVAEDESQMSESTEENFKSLNADVAAEEESQTSESGNDGSNNPITTPETSSEPEREEEQEEEEEEEEASDNPRLTTYINLQNQVRFSPT